MKSGKPRKDRRALGPAAASVGARREDALTTVEVARMLRVSTSTVGRWARDEKIPCHFTLGGHRRFERGAIERLSETVDRLGSWNEAAIDPGDRLPPKKPS